MRLDKFIATNTVFSRSDVRKLLKEQRIRVNGDTVKSPTIKIDEHDDLISLDGERLKADQSQYVMLNKPAGFICANTDAQHPTVLDLIADKRNALNAQDCPLDLGKLQIAGRLDIDTTGLVLLTTDGQWNHRITSPNVDAKKIYLVELDAPIASSVIEQFYKGIQLKGEKRKTRPATLEIIDPQRARLHLSEGKYHQVKRMFASTGNHVVSLHRESMAGIMLDPELPPGRFRSLSKAELDLAHIHVSKKVGGLK